MAEQPHPITPPPELVEEWRTAPEYASDREMLTMVSMTTRRLQEIVDQAVRWGYEQRGAVNEAELQKARDEELDACCEHIKNKKWFVTPEYRVAQLRAARRPKPKSRKQRALDALAQMESQSDAELTTEIRQALEELPDD